MATVLYRRTMAGASRYQRATDMAPVSTFPLRLTNYHSSTAIAGTSAPSAAKFAEVKFSTMQNVRTVHPEFCFHVFRKPNIITFTSIRRPYCVLQHVLATINAGAANIIVYRRMRRTNLVFDTSAYARITPEAIAELKRAGTGHARGKFHAAICRTPVAGSNAGATVFGTGAITAYGHTTIASAIDGAARINRSLHAIRHLLEPIDGPTTNERPNYVRSRAIGNAIAHQSIREQ